MGLLSLLLGTAPSASAQYSFTLEPAAVFEAPSSSHELGEVVAGAGDVNGDGYTDLLIASPDNPVGGVIYLVFGRGTGWPATIDVSDDSASFEGEVLHDDAGRGLDSAGDVNGDGLDDILIGAPENEDGGNGCGKAYLVLGRTSGWEFVEDLGLADASFVGQDTTENLGQAVAGAGDIDGDGYLDLAVAAPYDDEVASNAGEVHLFFGGPAGWQPDTPAGDASGSLRGEAEQDRAGNALAAAGDTNGDGLADLLIGAYHSSEAGDSAGQVYLVLGQPSGWNADADIGATAAASFLGEAAYDEAGAALAGGGDVNGDGLDDLLIGAWKNADTAEEAGKAYLVLGRTSGWTSGLSLTLADASFPGLFAEAWAGKTVAFAGDTNGDGLDDVLIGAPSGDYGVSDNGRAFLVLGRSSGWQPGMDLAMANGVIEGSDEAWAGFSVAGIGDATGDGLDDVLIGAPRHDGTWAGAGAGLFVAGYDCTDDDGDGVDLCHGDCDDGDVSVFWGAADDPCDGRDTDCDGTTDEFGDLDGDGLSVCDGDCNDADAAAFPGAVEICDEQDTDCDGVLSADEIDVDGDGFTVCDGDCDESDPSIHPGAVDDCGDGVDTDCAGDLDLEIDDDGDGFVECGGLAGEADCDDTDPAVHPGAEDICGDGVDGDCAGDLFEEIDQDEDGFPPCADDCDDYDDTVHPGADELLDGLDNDCDGSIDEAGEQPDDDDSAAEAGEEPADGCGCTSSRDRRGAGTAAVLLTLAIVAVLQVCTKRRRP